MRFFIIFLLASCAHPTVSGYKNLCESWVGNTETSLVDSWGYPTRTFNAPNGNKVHYYGASSSYKTPTKINTRSTHTGYGNYSHRSNVTGGNVINYICNTYFELNDLGIIISYKFNGNSCKSTYKKVLTAKDEVWEHEEQANCYLPENKSHPSCKDW